MVIQVCVGSSCHIKGSPEIIELLTKAVKDSGLEDEITLAGSFCIGKCNRLGVTVQVDDVYILNLTRTPGRGLPEGSHTVAVTWRVGA